MIKVKSMKKKIILFHHSKKKISLKNKSKKKLKKNFSEIIIYDSSRYKILNNNFIDKKLNNIKENYKKLGIHLNLDKIYRLDAFLKKIKIKIKNEKTFISPYFISNVLLEEEFIFYELSKIHKIQFVRPESSFVKNRFILSKNLFKQVYSLKKKTIFSKTNYNLLKNNYISSIETFSNRYKKSFINHFYKICLKILFSLFNFNLNKKPNTQYAIVILGNNTKLNSLTENIKLKNFVDKFFREYNYQLVFLLHPNTNILKFFIKEIRKKNYFLFNKKITFIQKPKNLITFLSKSIFIAHISSSLSAQSLFLDKKILCLSKNIMYLNQIDNIVESFIGADFNILKRKINKIEVSKIDKSIIKQLSNSVGYFGEFKLSTKKRYYSIRQKTHELKVIHSLLNAI